MRVGELEVERERLLADIAARDEQVHRLRTRLERILNSPPARAYARIGRLPVIRRVVQRADGGLRTTARQRPLVG